MKDLAVAVELAIQLSLLIFASLGCFHFIFFPLFFSSESEVFWSVFFSMAMLASISFRFTAHPSINLLDLVRQKLLIQMQWI